ncbi:IS630 family transposase [Vibrio harveyi]|uniref:IS630 family transposase n=1 Tax=Vibrio harveyi TaxID=669 RepID=UPI0036F2AE97
MGAQRQAKESRHTGAKCQTLSCWCFTYEDRQSLLCRQTSKNSELFIAMMEKLKSQYHRAKTITLIMDKYIIHKSKKTQSWRKKNPKFVLLFQPVYSPWVNKIEKLWYALHETITRNHQSKTMWKLLKQVRHFMNNASQFPGGGHGILKVEHN